MNYLFAAKQLDIEPEHLSAINNLGLFIYSLLLLFTVGYVIVRFMPRLIHHYLERRTEKTRVANSIWFDAKESILYCGYSKISIELRSIEYYLCKDTFANPSRYRLDDDIMEKVDHSKVSDRAVEQAVNRLNKKCLKEFGLNEKLLKRNKGSTSVNIIYRSRIVKP